MFGKIENWLGELCAAASADDEEGMGLFSYDAFDNSVPEEQFENEVEDYNYEIANNTEFRLNASRSRKYSVKRVNVRPALKLTQPALKTSQPALKSAPPAPSEELERENDQKEVHKKRCLKEYNPPTLPVTTNENGKTSDEKSIEQFQRSGNGRQKKESFADLHPSANFFDLRELPARRGISRYRSPKHTTKYLEANKQFLRRPSKKPHHNLLVPCNWTTEEPNSNESDTEQQHIPSKPPNASRRYFQKKPFKISGGQKTLKDRGEEIPVKRVVENKSGQINLDQEVYGDNFSNSSEEIFEPEIFLSYELINKAYLATEGFISNDPCFIEEPQANQPAECKVNICVMNLGDKEELSTREPPPQSELKDKAKIFGKMSFLDLKPKKSNKDVEEEVCFTDVEILKDGDWY